MPLAVVSEEDKEIPSTSFFEQQSFNLAEDFTFEKLLLVSAINTCHKNECKSSMTESTTPILKDRWNETA